MGLKKDRQLKHSDTFRQPEETFLQCTDVRKPDLEKKI